MFSHFLLSKGSLYKFSGNTASFYVFGGTSLKQFFACKAMSRLQKFTKLKLIEAVCNDTEKGGTEVPYVQGDAKVYLWNLFFDKSVYCK